jgi:hypothetical protein
VEQGATQHRISAIAQNPTLNEPKSFTLDTLGEKYCEEREMARNSKVEPEVQELPVEEETIDEPVTEKTAPEPVGEQDIDGILNSLKTLLSSVEKLQKIRQEVGDIKPLLLRMLDGDLVAGEELEQLKVGVSGLLRLVRAHSDHQSALEKAQTARSLLDDVFKTTSA